MVLPITDQKRSLAAEELGEEIANLKFLRNKIKNQCINDEKQLPNALLGRASTFFNFSFNFLNFSFLCFLVYRRKTLYKSHGTPGADTRWGSWGGFSPHKIHEIMVKLLTSKKVLLTI